MGYSVKGLVRGLSIRRVSGIKKLNRSLLAKPRHLLTHPKPTELKPKKELEMGKYKFEKAYEEKHHPSEEHGFKIPD